jgi:pantoate--beta-alanine ligase
MGALHEGHLSLIRRARAACDEVVVTVFVNPTQFDESGDLAAYPRDESRDAALAAEAGADVLFAPAAGEIYPRGFATTVTVDEISAPLEGAERGPAHFAGVATVVAKLLLAARPHVAVFGQKDFQQLAVIRRLVRDLCFDVQIVGAPIVREADGLALSSRNANLDPDARRQAPCLSRALDAAERAIASGERRPTRLLELVASELRKAARAEIDYAELRDPDTLEEITEPVAGPVLLALAVRFRALGAGSDVRLIDNRVLVPPRAEAGRVFGDAAASTRGSA